MKLSFEGNTTVATVERENGIVILSHLRMRFSFDIL